MNKKITKNGNETIVKIFEGKNTYTGKAKVHPDDVNFATDRVGSYIAESRARIKRHNKKAREHQKNIDKLLKEKMNSLIALMKIEKILKRFKRLPILLPKCLIN